jgi:TldD protein
MRDVFRELAATNTTDELIELRYHAKAHRSVAVTKGKLERSSFRQRDGVGVRVLVDGTWGFASTGETSRAAVQQAIDSARRSAKLSAPFRTNKVPHLPPENLAVGDFDEPGVQDVLDRPLDEKLDIVTRMEAYARNASSRMQSATCIYSEIHSNKVVVTSDGADAKFELVRPEFRIHTVAQKDGQLSAAAETIGVTGGWDCLFRDKPEVLADRAVKNAVDLLDAHHPEGGWATVIMAPSIVGLMVHEAIGHTVEADFVQSGSIAAGKLGQRVASELVTLCDSGLSEHHDGAGGTLHVDDEGVLTERTVIIEDGILASYLHNRESAAIFGVKPTGNGRAWEYADQPLIRMRNTYIEPGDSTLAEMIASTEDGYLLEGPRNGQADATGEFMFGVTTARRIRNGKLGELVKGVTVTGNAFDVLRTVDAVSKEFLWDLGSGHCGKGQLAKVDAGGPYIRCRAILGGTQG